MTTRPLYAPTAMPRRPGVTWRHRAGAEERERRQRERELQAQINATFIEPHINSIRDPITRERNKQLITEPICSICLANFSEEPSGLISVLPCQHIFHASCINQLDNVKCPICRSPFERFGHKKMKSKKKKKEK